MRKLLPVSFSAAAAIFICGIVNAQGSLDYSNREEECLARGWKQVTVDADGIKRKLLWKTPRGAWTHGAIIVFHGSGGNYTNWGSGPRPLEPMLEFSRIACDNGFAVFAPDSSFGLVTDEEGRAGGKRFDCMAIDTRANIDLPFIEKIITDVIPEARSAGSSRDIFIMGISNGGFMTILAATHFDDKITAFAPVSAEDPYGTHLDCSAGFTDRDNAPGVPVDNETGKSILEDDAAVAQSYPHEKEWQSANPKIKPAFKQFHNVADGAVDISCMKKAQALLVQHGYRDDGPYIVNDGSSKSILKHFWSRQYNRPIINFFIRSRSDNP